MQKSINHQAAAKRQSAGAQIKRLGKESVIYGISTVLARFLNFFLTPFYTYYLPAEQYGIIAAVYSYIAFLNILYHYALDQAYMRHCSDKIAAFSAAFKFQMATTSFLTFLLCAFSGFWSSLGGIAEKYVYFAAAILVLDTLTLLPFTELRMRHKAGKYAMLKSFGIMLNVFIIALMIGAFGCGIDCVFWANILASLAQLIGLIPEFKLLSFKKRSKDKALLKLMLQYAWPLFIAAAGTMIVQIFDRPVMLKMMDEAAVGIYQAAVKLGIFMQLLVNMFDTAWRAFVIECIGQKDAPKLFARIFTYFMAFGLLAWLILSFFTSDLVQLKICGKSLFSPRYWGALNLLPVFFGANLLYGVYINLLAPIIITKKTFISLIVTIIASFISIAGNLILIPRLGMAGGAIALVLSYFAMCALMFSLCRRIYPVPYEYKRLSILIIAALLCFALGYLASAKSYLIVRIVCIIVFPAMLWHTGFFSAAEKKQLKRFFINKLKIKKA